MDRGGGGYDARRIAARIRAGAHWPSLQILVEADEYCLLRDFEDVAVVAAALRERTTPVRSLMIGWLSAPDAVLASLVREITATTVRLSGGERGRSCHITDTPFGPLAAAALGDAARTCFDSVAFHGPPLMHLETWRAFEAACGDAALRELMVYNSAVSSEIVVPVLDFAARCASLQVLYLYCKDTEPMFVAAAAARVMERSLTMAKLEVHGVDVTSASAAVVARGIAAAGPQFRVLEFESSEYDRVRVFSAPVAAAISESAAAWTAVGVGWHQYDDEVARAALDRERMRLGVAVLQSAPVGPGGRTVADVDGDHSISLRVIEHMLGPRRPPAPQRRA